MCKLPAESTFGITFYHHTHNYLKEIKKKKESHSLLFFLVQEFRGYLACRWFLEWGWSREMLLQLWTFIIHLHLLPAALSWERALSTTVDNTWGLIILSFWRSIEVRRGEAIWILWSKLPADSFCCHVSKFPSTEQAAPTPSHCCWAFPSCGPEDSTPNCGFRRSIRLKKLNQTWKVSEFSFSKSARWTVGEGVVGKKRLHAYLLKESCSLPDLSQMAREKGWEEAQPPSEEANVSSSNAI